MEGLQLQQQFEVKVEGPLHLHHNRDLFDLYLSI